MIRPVNSTDASVVARIYNHYVANTRVTFEESAVSVEDMVGRIREIELATLPFLVAEQGGEVVGYAFASKWKGRCAYRYSSEITVYLDANHTRRGVGSSLYAVLLPQLKERGIHAVIGGIALPNDASVALHEKFGLSQVACFKEVGYKFGKWIDVGYWQRIL